MDPWDTEAWEQNRQRLVAEQRESDERDRHAIAELLEARQLGRAAVLVAASEYRCVQVDNFDGGQYEGHFAVPASVYDHAVAEPVRSALEEATRAVIGAAHFAGVDVVLQRRTPEQGWKEALARRLLDEQAPSADPAPLLALLPGPTSPDASST